MKHMIDAILGPRPTADEGPSGPDDEIKIIAQELIEAVHARNVDDTVAALRAAFQCFDAEPHVEGPHEPEG